MALRAATIHFCKDASYFCRFALPAPTTNVTRTISSRSEHGVEKASVINLPASYALLMEPRSNSSRSVMLRTLPARPLKEAIVS